MTQDIVPPDIDLNTVADRAKEILDRGGAFYQKWTCRGCGERVDGTVMNRLFIYGEHQEKADGSPCGFITDLRKHGCGFTAILGRGVQRLAEQLEAEVHDHCTHQDHNHCCQCNKPKP